ncbi:MAG TPA: PQQ-dependent sugar dehydrogenase [Vicinamibacterales bacterium]
METSATFRASSRSAIVWLPSIGITGMAFYRGSAFPHWRNNLFVTSLRQGEVPRTGHLERIVFNER